LKASKHQFSEKRRKNQIIQAQVAAAVLPKNFPLNDAKLPLAPRAAFNEASKAKST
jgi:hypothetical protein